MPIEHHYDEAEHKAIVAFLKEHDIQDGFLFSEKPNASRTITKNPRMRVMVTTGRYEQTEQSTRPVIFTINVLDEQLAERFAAIIEQVVQDAKATG